MTPEGQPDRLHGFQSPDWQPGTRLMVAVIMILILGALLIALRQLMAALLIALILAYILAPLIERLQEWINLPRWSAVLITFLVLLIILGGTTTGVGLAASQGIIGLADYLGELSTQIPSRIEDLMEFSFTIGPWRFGIGDTTASQVVEYLTSAIQPLLSQTGSLLANIAGATATAVGTLLIVLVLAIYLSMELPELSGKVLRLVPDPYQSDIRHLLEETGEVWQSFLRGQVILGLVVGGVTALVYTVLNLRFAIGLGAIAGMLEFVPIFGPVIAGLIAVLVALFQGSNWFNLAPLYYAGVVLLAAVIIQQIENNILVPRIIGRSLKMSPLIVLLAVLAGGNLAGVLGVLLAAPAVATFRLWGGYLYAKATMLDSQVGRVLGPPPKQRRFALGRRIIERLRSIRSEGSESSPSTPSTSGDEVSKAS